MKTVHTPVLTEQVVHYLDSCRDGICVDCTLGEAGHSRAILEQVKPEKLLAIEADSAILERSKENLKEHSNVDLIRGNFKRLKEILDERGIKKVNGILFDLGISMYHYKESGRGFSFDKDEVLDMRIDDRTALTAAEVVNEYSEEKLKNLIWAYGEERWASLIAHRIVERRKIRRIETARELAEIVSATVPKKFHGTLHPATRVFQAVRIEVNNELDNLEGIIRNAAEFLEEGGKLVIISFHSLEDRIVKHGFQELSEAHVVDEVRGTRAPADYKVLTKKPVTATEEEVRANPASRSAKLRALQKVSP
jgi:16S rRNA (cytosine1402-N4)-methyltransferase